MRKPQGYSQVVGGGVGVTADPGLQALGNFGEADTFTCSHCQSIVHVPPRADPSSIGGLCKTCMGLICPRCLGKACVPWERAMHDLENAIERRRVVDSYL